MKFKKIGLCVHVYPSFKLYVGLWVFKTYEYMQYSHSIFILFTKNEENNHLILNRLQNFLLNKHCSKVNNEQQRRYYPLKFSDSHSTEPVDQG